MSFILALPYENLPKSGNIFAILYNFTAVLFENFAFLCFLSAKGRFNDQKTMFF